MKGRESYRGKKPTGHAESQEPKAESVDLQLRASELWLDTEGSLIVARCSSARHSSEAPV